MIVGYETVRPEDVASHYQCRLGQWYFDEQTKKQLQGTPAYEKLNAPHERVHVAAKKAVEAYAKGDLKGAEAQLIELEQASAEVIHPISRRRLPLQRPKGVSGRGMRVPPFFCV